MSDGWSHVSRASSALGGCKHKAESDTGSNAPSNNPVKAFRDSFKGTGSDEGGNMPHHNGGESRSSLVNDLERANASPANTGTTNVTHGEQSNIHLEEDHSFFLQELARLQGCFQASSRPDSQNKFETDNVSGLTPSGAGMNRQIGGPLELPMKTYKAAGGLDGMALSRDRYTVRPSHSSSANSPVFEKIQPDLPASYIRDASTDHLTKQKTNFQRATVETESEPHRSPPASVRWDKSVWHGGNCDCWDCRGLYGNSSRNSPVQELKKIKDVDAWGNPLSRDWGNVSHGSCGKISNGDWSDHPPLRGRLGAAPVSRDGNNTGWRNEVQQGNLNFTSDRATEVRRYCDWCGALYGWCDCDEVARHEEKTQKINSSRRGWEDDDDLPSLFSKRYPKFKLESDGSVDGGEWGKPSPRSGNNEYSHANQAAHAIAAKPVYSHTDVRAGAGGACNTVNNASYVPAQQPVGVHPDMAAW